MQIRKLILVVFGISFLIPAAGWTQAKSPTIWNDPVKQWAVVKFSHKLHLTEVGAECTTCHVKADSSTHSSDLLLPTMETCGDCHDVEDEEQCSMCHVSEDRMEAYEPAQRNIQFSHKRHLTQGLGCTNCHKGMEALEKPTTAVLPAMATCTTCHNGVKAINTCEACHTNIETLQPLSHQQIDWVKEHKRVVRVETPANECASCHTDNFCQTCHAEVGLQTTKGLFLRPIPENRPMPLGKQALVKQNVHQLNFLFTHSIEFRTKRSDCFTCHDQQQFCQDCHAKNQDAGFTSPVPLSHQGADFTRIGAGSGGGQHAALAKKDIESCAACHDVEGADPVCITCHVDRTPGLGNDPKTHPKNFRNDEGEWHHDSGAVCFQCHTNTNQPGIGFCGYCHGVK